MKEIYELKVGDKIELRDDLVSGKEYGDDYYESDIPKISHVQTIWAAKVDIRETNYCVTPEMISKINNKKVEFVDGFKYIIKEYKEMIDPKSLVQSGDFVVYEWMGNEHVSLAIQRGEEIILIDNPRGFVDLNDKRLTPTNIKKIFRYNSTHYRVGSGFNGNFDEEYGKIIYDREKEIKEMTMEEVNKALGYKVKIVEGK